MHISVEILILLALSSLTLSIPTLPLENSPQNESTSSRVVNGEFVDITSVPYQAALRRRLSTSWAHTCGAIIISNRALLTAAHCVITYKLQPEMYRIVVGTSNRLSGGINIELTQIIVHEYYSTTTWKNDIALLVTASTITFSQSVNAIAIAPSDLNLEEGAEALVTGYGSTSYEGQASSVLLGATVYIVSQQNCTNAYQNLAYIFSGMICASASNPARDACQGDSGGPLISGDYLVGIVSWGEGCANPLYPGVYTRVSAYNSWVTDNLNQLETD